MRRHLATPTEIDDAVDQDERAAPSPKPELPYLDDLADLENLKPLTPAPDAPPYSPPDAPEEEPPEAPEGDDAEVPAGGLPYLDDAAELPAIEPAGAPGDTGTGTDSDAGAVAPTPGKLGYLPALDGLRAVAVLLVIGYHVGYSGLAGGYIGVEVFFILSGWLVCALLVGEHRASGGISLGQFWLRRARRLLPAMVVVTVATLAVAAAVDPDRVADLRSDAFAALTYHLNWRLILDHQSYFAAADGPSALEHLWSLSIEEQFYLAFPLVAAGLLVRRRTSAAVAIVLAGVLASTALRLAWYDPGVDPSRVYFGTDTRAAGLLAGAALGLFWVPQRLRRRSDWWSARALDAVAVAGLGVIGWYTTRISEQDGTAFGAGFTLVQVATLAVIAAVVFPAPTLAGRALAVAPLRWVGQRSYGIYLIHWPVIVFTSRAPGQQPEAPLRVAAQVGAIGVLAAVSYRWVEQPIRRRGLAATGREVRDRLGTGLAGRPVATTAVLAAGIGLVGGTVGVGRSVFSAEEPEVSQAESVVITSPPGPATSRPPAVVPVTTAPAARPAAPPAPPAPPPPPAYPPTTAIGDSVMAGGADALAQRMGPALGLDATVGRQLNEAPEVLRGMAQSNRLGHVVVVHLGNNGPFTAAEIDELFATIGPGREVVLVTVFVPRRWEGEVNDNLHAAAGRHPNARLADWRAVAGAEPGLLADDGYHLNPAGAQRYADVVTAAVTA